MKGGAIMESKKQGRIIEERDGESGNSNGAGLVQECPHSASIRDQFINYGVLREKDEKQD